MDQNLLEELRSRHEGKVFAFFSVPNANPRPIEPYTLAVAVLGEDGYYPLDRFFYEPDAASAEADRLNRELGYSPETAACIVGDTMRRSQLKQDAARGLVTVKLSSEQIEVISDTLVRFDAASDQIDEIVEMLEEAREELGESLPKMG